MIPFEVIPIISIPSNPQAEAMFNFFFSLPMWFGAIAFIAGLFVRWMTRT